MSIMARDTRRFLSDAPSEKLSPRHLTKRLFGRRLNDLMSARGWTQAELARNAGLTRDNVSTYIRGRTFPEPRNLQKLADVFGLKPEDLLPNSAEQAIELDTEPEFSMTVSGGKTWIRLNRMVSAATAAKIVQLLTEDETSE